MADIKDALKRLVAELEADEQKEGAAELIARLERIESRLDDTDKRLSDLTPAEREVVDDAVAAVAEGQADEEEAEAEAEKPRRTRPGRKTGKPYMWTVDDTGHVRKTDIAHIYNGEDEPDEVELPDDDEAEAAA